MELRFFLLADFANVSDSKLNIIGSFNTIEASQFPTQRPNMYLAARVAAGSGEYEAEHAIKVQLFDEDDNELGKVEGKLSFPKPASGHISEVQIVISIREPRFDKMGLYEFRLLINDHLLGTIPLNLVQLEETSQAN